MDSYTLIWVTDQHSRPQQISIPKLRVKQAAIGVAVALVVFTAAVWDYWRLRADNSELAGLRVETADQREQIAIFEHRLESVDSQLDRVTELERKVRIIANLPGTAGVGGETLTELAPPAEGAVGLPVGVPVEQVGSPPVEHIGQGGDEPLETPESAAVQKLGVLGHKAVGLAGDAGVRADSLEILLGQLEDKRQRLVSMPSVWPARGWLTSRFGPRVSPFTGRRHKHSGIDIAAASGTPINAPAKGRVTFVGKKGPLGNTLVVDHGFGVRTVYGHTRKIHVRPGDTIERGQRIAEIGSTGRSTGPHLHYVVEVSGKPRNPLDYILD